MTILDSSDLVFSRDQAGKIDAGGFNINSYLLGKGECGSYIYNDVNNNKIGGGGIPISNVSDMFKGLAVPAGLLYLQQNVGNNYSKVSSNDVASQGLFDRLLNFASELPDANKKTYTRNIKSTSRKKKSKTKTNNKTRKTTRKSR